MGEPYGAPQEQQGNGTVLLSLAVVSLIFAIVGITMNAFWLVIDMSILAMILGHFGFKRLEKSNADIPPKVVSENRAFLLVLKDQSPITINVEIHYETVNDVPLTHERIMARIQRELGQYFIQRDSLPKKNPYPIIDEVLLPIIEPLRKELKLDTLVLRTISALDGDVTGGTHFAETRW